MTKLQKNAFIFLFILFQTILAISSGMLVLYFVTKDNIPSNLYISSINVGGLNRQEAEKKLEEHFENLIKGKTLKIKYSEKGQSEIKFSDIDASVDYNSTIDRAMGKKGQETFKNFVRGYFSSKTSLINPVIQFNESILKQKLNEIALLINKEPVNANIYIKDDKVIKEPEIAGLKLNIEKAVKKVKDELGSHLSEPIEFKQSNNFEIEVVSPKVELRDIDDADDIIARYTTEIKSLDRMDSIKLASTAINKVVIYPEEKEFGEEAGEFSFNKYLSDEKGIMEQDNEGYNQVVSTLNAAVLLADIKPTARTLHKVPADYIEKGLDAVVLGNSVDYRFKNTLDNTLVVFSEIKGNKLTVSLVSKKKDSPGLVSLKVEIGQKYDPSVINVENQDLKAGESKVISQGKEGFDVSVYKTVQKDGAEVGKKLLFTDKYDAVDTIVQIGPNTKWYNKSTK